MSRDKSARRSAQDDVFVGVLKKNIPNKLALMGQRPTYEDENGFYSATSLPGSAALPFVISTGAQRSGEISVLMPLLGNVFRRSEAEGSAVPRTFRGYVFDRA